MVTFSKKIVIAGGLTTLVVILSVYLYSSQYSSELFTEPVSTVPSDKKPSYVKKYLNDEIEVRSFPSEFNPALCGYDEVVDVTTNKKLYGAGMCEKNIIDIVPKGNQLEIITDWGTTIRSEDTPRSNVIVVDRY